MQLSVLGFWVFLILIWYFLLFFLGLITSFFFSEGIRKEIMNTMDQNTTLGWYRYFHYSWDRVWIHYVWNFGASVMLGVMVIIIIVNLIDSRIDPFVETIAVGMSFYLQYRLIRLAIGLHDKYQKNEYKLKKMSAEYYILFGHVPRKVIRSTIWVSTALHLILLTKAITAHRI